MELALQPGRFIAYGEGRDFVSSLEGVAGQLEKLVQVDPERALSLYETFLAGCYEKAEELNDSSGTFGTVVVSLYCGWIKARQAAGADAGATATWLLERMENDPYGLASTLERDVVTVMHKDSLAAFERHVKARFEAIDAAGPAAESAHRRDPTSTRRRWGDVLRAIYTRRRDVRAYVALCEQSALSTQDCLAVATMLKAKRNLNEALAWVDRGLAVDKQHPHGSIARYDLAKPKRELLTKLGRRDDALEDAWTEFCQHPSTFSYQELMRFVAKAERAAWHARALDVAEHADLGSLIELWLETREIKRLARRLGMATDTEIQDLSHYQTEPAARRLARSHPDVAARVYRALGVRILNARKSKYYGAALSHFENARRCYERSGHLREWAALVAAVRGAHRRKAGFMADFERLAAGQALTQALSFLERARRRWGARAEP